MTWRDSLYGWLVALALVAVPVLAIMYVAIAESGG